MSELRVLTTEGDLKLHWDKDNDEEVDAAEQTFKKYTKKGWTAYKVSRTGGKGTIISEFDEDAERVILIPPLEGG